MPNSIINNSFSTHPYLFYSGLYQKGIYELVKLRLLAHNLAIESGRYNHVIRSNRLYIYVNFNLQFEFN